jgi:hypothetical protein
MAIAVAIRFIEPTIFSSEQRLMVVSLFLEVHALGLGSEAIRRPPGEKTDGTSRAGFLDERSGSKN